jgi:hypothetical protein
VPPDLRFEARPEGPDDEPEVPTDIWKAALLIMPDPEGWLYNPIPAHKGKTPLELLALGQDDKLRSILQSIAPTFLPPPSEIIPWTEDDAEGPAGGA